MKIGKDSFLHNRPGAPPSNVVLTVLQSGFVECGTRVGLKYLSECDGTICKHIQFQNHFQRVSIDNTFGPTSLKRISVLLVEGNDRVYSCMHRSYFCFILKRWESKINRKCLDL